MKDEDIENIATYLFKRKVRTRCRFSHIFKIKNVDDVYVVYALFVCKRRILVKHIRIKNDGTLQE